MTPHPIERRWPVTPRLNVAVDAAGCVLVEVTSPDGQADLRYAQHLHDALSSAQFYALVVHPPYRPGRIDAPGAREHAYDLVEAELAGMPPTVAADHVDRFLREFFTSGHDDMNLWYSSRWRWMPGGAEAEPPLGGCFIAGPDGTSHGRIYLAEGTIPTDADLGEGRT